MKHELEKKKWNKKEYTAGFEPVLVVSEGQILSTTLRGGAADLGFHFMLCAQKDIYIKYEAKYKLGADIPIFHDVTAENVR